MAFFVRCCIILSLSQPFGVKGGDVAEETVVAFKDVDGLEKFLGSGVVKIAEFDLADGGLALGGN